MVPSVADRAGPTLSGDSRTPAPGLIERMKHPTPFTQAIALARRALDLVAGLAEVAALPPAGAPLGAAPEQPSTDRPRH